MAGKKREGKEVEREEREGAVIGKGRWKRDGIGEEERRENERERDRRRIKEGDGRKGEK